MISELYDRYYEKWCKTVNANEIAEKLKNKDVPKELLNHYTIIQVDKDGKLYDVSYAEFFEKEYAPIIEEFDAMISKLNKLPEKTSEQKAYIAYLSQHRACLAERDKKKLEDQWCLLDKLWMDVKYPIQIVHDIEYGYGDPTRSKVDPEFSVRIVDDAYAESNKIINETVKSVMVEYFKKRDAELAKKGLNALTNSHAAIYYVVFQCGISLHFRFSGQSIPNRSEVKNTKVSKYSLIQQVPKTMTANNH